MLSSMTISLTPETQQILEREMKRGGYSSVDDLVRTALRTLEGAHAIDEHEDLDEPTRAALERGEEQFVKGDVIPLDEAFQEIRRRHFGK